MCRILLCQRRFLSNYLNTHFRKNAGEVDRSFTLLETSEGMIHPQYWHISLVFHLIPLGCFIQLTETVVGRQLLFLIFMQFIVMASSRPVFIIVSTKPYPVCIF